MTDKDEEIWRRVVPSPLPLGIVEIDIIEACYLSGNIPIAVGGGGIPVVRVTYPKKMQEVKLMYAIMEYLITGRSRRVKNPHPFIKVSKV